MIGELEVTPKDCGDRITRIMGGKDAPMVLAMRLS
jgi:hypothetical protein